MHKDQARLQSRFPPILMGRILSDDPAAVRDCTLMNRMFVQGPDPLFIMETCPDEFGRLCANLDLDVEKGRQAIVLAHAQGPGVLLAGRGFEVMPSLTTMTDVPEAHRQEMLWLILAACSDCTETGYDDTVSLTDRIQRSVSACLRFQQASCREGLELVQAAWGIAERFMFTTVFTQDMKFDVPLSDADHAFYVGFKLGMPAIAVRAGTSTFYGTVPGTTLAAQGITVDKQISPQFGICFG